MTQIRAGSFCTSVLRTTDVERAVKFYSALVGWTTQEVPRDSHHRLFEYDGKTVASIQQIANGPDLWVPHVLVVDIDGTILDAVNLGATVIDKTDIAEFARLATLRDPEGAEFGLWQPMPHQGAEMMEQVGGLWWIEVLSSDVAAARDFYGRLFGWTSVETKFEPFESYIVFKRGDIQEGGILPIGRGWDVAPHWGSIFSVQDCDAMIARAKELGGSEIFVHTVPKAGRVGSVRDSGSAAFVMRGPIK